MEESQFKEYLNNNYRNTSSFRSGLALFITDAISLFLSIGFSFFIVNLFNSSAINFRSFVNYTVYIPFILILFACLGLYPGIMSSPTEDVKKFFLSCFCCFVGMIISLVVIENNSDRFTNLLIKDSQNTAISIALLITIPVATIVLPGLREVVKHIFQYKKWWGVPAVFYCSDDSAYYIVDKMINNKSLGYHPVVIINTSASEPTLYKNIPVYNQKPEILKIIKEHNIKQAVICDFKGDMNHVMASYRYTITVSKHQDYFTSTQQIKDIAGIVGFASIHNLTFKRSIFFKRFLDIFIVLVASPFWLPVVLILCILTKLTSKGPVFYGHKRVGKNGKEIKCWKFRSMCINSQEILEQILATDPVRREEWEKDRKFQDDPRVTKFGKFLRKTSLDELPQLFNILKGDMSLIGPRPVTEPELVKYGEYKDYVLSVTPGLSGLWQVSGRSDTGYEERISFDTFYIQNWSIWLDIWILIKTVWVVINGKGAY